MILQRFTIFVKIKFPVKNRFDEIIAHTFIDVIQCLIMIRV